MNILCYHTSQLRPGPNKVIQGKIYLNFKFQTQDFATLDIIFDIVKFVLKSLLASPSEAAAYSL